MAARDIRDVMRIERECFRSPWHESAYRNELTNPASVYVVAQADKRIVGFAGMWVIVDEGHITTIGVEEKFRGRHIGEKLLVALIEETLDRGAARMTLEVRRSNLVAQNLYCKYGFETAGIRPCYYTDNNEDALILWLNDMDAPPFRSRLKRLTTFLESG
ncbi:MAG: ribosomal protein S18-alanine N-acetyltransferase [Armatimonadetes bacterium]|nr:ribosomal protein S18-alanine N-acetyltransferase [Armatimonadota bacterium]